jgi:hypothetical protein
MGQADQVMYRGRERITVDTRTKPARSSLVTKVDFDEASMRTVDFTNKCTFTRAPYERLDVPSRVAFQAQLSHLTITTIVWKLVGAHS